MRQLRHHSPCAHLFNYWRNKHIDIASHFARDAVKQKVASLYHCPGSEMSANIPTKPLGRILFEKFIGMLGPNREKLHKNMLTRGDSGNKRQHTVFTVSESSSTKSVANK